MILRTLRALLNNTFIDPSFFTDDSLSNFKFWFIVNLNVENSDEFIILQNLLGFVQEHLLAFLVPLYLLEIKVLYKWCHRSFSCIWCKDRCIWTKLS